VDKKQMIKKELNKTIKIENGILKKENRVILGNKAEIVAEKINDKLPFDVKEKFKNAFKKSLQSVTTKGIKIIEKTYDRKKLSDLYIEDTELFKKEIKRRNLRAVEKRAKRKAILNTGISTMEGTAVGFMGILTALADVPVFISIIMKHLNETALHYGFDYDTDLERAYMFKIISMSVADREKKQIYSKEIDKIGYSIDVGDIIEINNREIIEETASNLSEYVSMAILLGSIPLAGFVFGGINNYRFMSHVAKIANVKYKKRYLYRMMTMDN